MVRRRQREIHVNNERWLVSYADFITLLFAFFVVMYSISQVNQSKYRVLSETFVEAFNQPNDSKANPMPQEKVSPSNDAITPIDMGKHEAKLREEEELLHEIFQPDHVELIQKSLKIMKLKSLMVKKRGIRNDIENLLDEYLMKEKMTYA